MAWREVALDTLTLSTAHDWRILDPVTLEKLKTSIRAHGLLRAPVVRGNVVIEGRKIVRALRELGRDTVMVVDAPDDREAVTLGLDIEFEPDYATLAYYVKTLLDNGHAASDLAAVSPHTAQRLEYFRVLTTFDWSQYVEGHQQQNLWEDEETEAPDVAPPEIDEVAVEDTPPPPPPPAPPPPAPVTSRPRGIPEIEPVGRDDDYPVGRPAPRKPSVVDGPAVTDFAFEPSTEPTSVFFSPPPPVVDERPPTVELPSLEGITELGYDTETTGLRWHDGDRPVGLCLYHPSIGAFYLPFGHRGGGNLCEATVKQWAQRELRGKKLYGSNTKFDVHMTRAWGVDLEEQGCTVGDIGHYAALLNNLRRKFGLEVLSQEFLGRGKREEGLDKTRLAEYHSSAVSEYAKEDAKLAWDLKEAMWPKLAAEDLHRVRELEDRLIFAVCEMERNAAPIDEELLHRWNRETEQETHRCLRLIAEAVGFQVNPDKTDDMIRLFEALGLPITAFTDKGTPSFTDNLLKHIDHPVIQLTRRAGKLASLRSKYFIPYSRQVTGGKLRYDLHQLRSDEHGTVSGRFSSSDVNIQQVMEPSKQEDAFGSDDFIVRKLFIPLSGRWLAADARQIEYRLFAHYSNSQAILAAYAADPLLSYHKLVHSMLEPYSPGLPYFRAKNFNFAKVYGAGVKKTAEMLEIPLDEAEKLDHVYFRMFPETKDMLRLTSDLAKRRGWVKTMLGRRARFENGEFTHKALNAIIQGTAAEAMKLKIVELHDARKDTGFIMRMTVHDEVDGDAPDEECVRKVTDILQAQSLPTKVPILWDIGTGANWAEAK